MSLQKKTVADRRRAILYATLGIVVIAFVGLVGYFSIPQTVPTASKAPVYASLKAGSTAPEFTLSTTAGPFDLAKSHDKPVLLEVFATWCPHCQREVGVLNAIYGADKNKIHMVAVNGSSSASETDPTIPETQANVISFGQRFNVQYPIAFDADLTVANLYLEGGFPTIVLIGRDGKVQATNSGETPQDGLQSAIDKSVAGRVPDGTFGVKAQQ